MNSHEQPGPSTAQCKELQKSSNNNVVAMRMLWGFDLPSQNNFTVVVERENYSQHPTEKGFFQYSHGQNVCCYIFYTSKSHNFHC